MEIGCQLEEVTIEWIGSKWSDQGTNCCYCLWLLQWITRGDESPRMCIEQRGYTVSPQALISLAAWGGRGAEETMWWRSIIRQICTEDRITWYGHNSCWPFVNKVYCACCCFLSWVVLWVFYRLIGTRSSYWLLPVQKQENRSSQNLHPGYMRRLAKLAGCAPKDREGGRFYQSICWRPLLYLQTLPKLWKALESSWSP